MRHVLRPSPFVLMSTNHGTMIVNRNDYHQLPDGGAYGVGFTLLNFGSFDVNEISLLIKMLEIRRAHFGDGVVAIDGGANIGIYTIDLALAIQGWGHVYAFEAQEKIYYALAGNVVLNNALNVSAIHSALGREVGTIKIPEPNYLVPASYGSFELKPLAHGNENIGQPINYNVLTKEVNLLSIDSINLPRLDLLKIDVEGMEEDVLEGAAETIQRCKPALMIETIKSDYKKITEPLLSYGYKLYPAHMNLFALHESDPIIKELNLGEQEVAA